jgi:hypothetical protein
MVAPPLGAPDVRATVQTELTVGDIDRGLQEKPFSPGFCWMATVVPTSETRSDEATESAAMLLPSWTAVEVLAVEVDRVRAAVAMTPLGAGVDNRPQSTHERPPTTGLQLTNLPAAVARGDAVITAATTSVLE